MTVPCSRITNSVTNYGEPKKTLFKFEICLEVQLSEYISATATGHLGTPNLFDFMIYLNIKWAR